LVLALYLIRQSIKAKVQMSSKFNQLLNYIKENNLTSSSESQIKQQYEDVWSVLANQVLDNKKELKSNEVYIQGITAMQGTGKTTLSKILIFLLELEGLRVATVSIDDFYKTYKDRQEILKTNPEFIFRGPPGTHDLDLISDLFSDLKDTEKNIAKIPRFNKSLFKGQGDREKEFEIINKPVDVLLLEGWFVGFEAIPEEVLESSKLFEIKNNLSLALKSNHKLQEYETFWNKLDSLILLYPEQFEYSIEWRLEAEEKMKASGKNGMSESEIRDFVAYFWASLHPAIYVNNLKQKEGVLKLEVDKNHLIKL
jgi:D-glycerate 3-kinase